VIQAIADKDQAQTLNTVYLMLRDEMLNNTYKPLIAIQSQMTNTFGYFIPTTWDITTNPSRYGKMTFSTTNTGEGGATTGLVTVGTPTRPFGLYNVTIYENVSNDNVDVNLVSTVIYETMMYIKAVNNDNVEFKEVGFKTNSPIFITNPLP
tara:strand:+ start:3065 stop:3517 length:453 start_codon:yes stop_codon:yes gene_type:complete